MSYITREMIALFASPQSLSAQSKGMGKRPYILTKGMCVGSPVVISIEQSHLNYFTHEIINPRCACSAMVTILSVCVCVCVCLSPLILALQVPNRLMSDTNDSSTTSARKTMR